MVTTPGQARTEVAGERRAIELSRCALVVLAGPERGRQWELSGDVVRIGKSPDCDVVLDDPTVSRTHCELVRDARGYLVRDLGSTNGTLLDGTAVREAYVRPGALLTVGKVELRIRPYAERIELLPSEQQRFGGVVGRSVRMREIFGLLERIAPTDATVLLTGETGTGKDALARAVHEHSPRRSRPFIVVDCGAVVGTLIESELFGHERGAFTGAIAQRQGAFELAHGGTLFLDEIGELPLDLQPKLLRAIETRTIRRVGGSRDLRVDIRVIAATKRNLRLEVERGKFREDLYFRLAVVPVELPPLRERREDIPLLVEHLLARIAESAGSSTAQPGLAPGALDSLCAHDWPGNVRELRNVLERAVYLTIAAGQNEVRVGLPTAPLATPTTGDGSEPFDPSLSYREQKARFEENFERRYVRWLLTRHGGNISAAARAAEMDRKYLHKLARKHGVHPSDANDDDA
ncbi:MAG: sigma 54-interacting transcriptional regulator [Myxococcales bacterium]|nr:sigma 54-interacting transcriptional regulator [Myxococcales bacterium]